MPFLSKKTQENRKLHHITSKKKQKTTKEVRKNKGRKKEGKKKRKKRKEKRRKEKERKGFFLRT